MMSNTWKTVTTKHIYDNPWISVREDKVINPSGGDGIYGVVSFKYRAIGVIPIDEQGFTYLVGQHRYSLDEYSWEIPMGGGPKNELPIEAAKRELKEETGFTAEKWEEIAKIHTSNSVTDEEGYIFVAENLTAGATEFDETEDLKVWRLPLSEAIELVMNNTITDSLTVYGLLKIARLRNL
jgi:8-oxo-dGTP pyrophosphatase MutT (NUDIX family)